MTHSLAEPLSHDQQVRDDFALLPATVSAQLR